MKELGSNAVTEDFFTTIWMEQLLVSSPAILSASTINLSELAKVGAKIAEIREIFTVNEISLGESMRNLTEAIRKVIAKLKCLIYVFFSKVNRQSPWVSPIHAIPKSNVIYRIRGDYRRLNSITVADRYFIPHIHDITNVLHKKSFFFTN